MKKSRIDIKSTGPNVPGYQWPIRIMRELGYKNSDVTKGTGICAGIASMGIHAILLNKLEAFDERLETMAKMVDVPKLTAAKKYIEGGFYCLIGKQEEWVNKYLNSIKINTAIFNAGFDVTNKEVNVDIRAFLDGVALYQSPNEYPDILCEDTKQQLTQFSGFPVVTKIISPKLPQQNNADNTAAIEEVTPCFSGCYSQEELTTYFTKLANTIIDSNYTDPVSVLISCNKHLVSVGYHNNQWIFIDINKLSIRYVQTNEEIAKEVYRAFTLDVSTHLYFWLSQLNHRFEAPRVMATTIYVNHTNDVDKEHAFQTLKENIKKFKKLKIHKVTPNKIKNNTTWFHVAFCHNDYPTIKELLNHRVLPTSNHLNTAIYNKDYELTKLLLQHNTPPTSDHLYIAIGNKDYELIKLLLQYNTTPPTSNHLYIAIGNNDYTLTELLIPYVFPTSEHLNSAIYVKHVNIELTKLLLTSHTVFPTSEHLNYAIVKQNVELIKLLLEHNVTVTPEHLHTAKLFNVTEIIPLLESKLATTTPAPLLFHRECPPSSVSAPTTTLEEADEPKAKKPKMNH